MERVYYNTIIKVEGDRSIGWQLIELKEHTEEERWFYNMKNLSFEELEKAHKANNMFYLTHLNTGHEVFVRIESTNFFEGEPDYAKGKGFSSENLVQLRIKELEELGFIPERKCEPSQRPRQKFKDFYNNPLISKLTDKGEQCLNLVFDSEFYQEYRVYTKTGELVYTTFEQKEAKNFLETSKDYNVVQNYEIMTSMACSLYMQNNIITFNIISPIELLNRTCHYEEMPKIDMTELLQLIMRTCGIDCATYTRKSIDNGKLEKKSKTLNFTFIAHNGRAEWNKFNWFTTITFDDKGKYDPTQFGQPVMNYISNIQGGDITVTEFQTLIPKTKNKVQNISVFIADTMALVDQDHKKAEAMGKLTDMGEMAEKVHISSYEISHMNVLLREDPEKYIRYAVQDTIVPLVYVASLYGVNVKPDITLLTGAQRVVVEQLCQQYMNYASSYVQYVEDYVLRKELTDKKGNPLPFRAKDGSLTNTALDILYRGLVPEHENTKDTRLPLYAKNGLVAVNKGMRDLLRMAQDAYSGGENFCQYISIPKRKTVKTNIVGTGRPKKKWKPERKSKYKGEGRIDKNEGVLYYDLDIPSAYPTCIYPIVAVNVLDPIAYFIKKDITIDGSTKEGKQKFKDLRKTIVKAINRKNIGIAQPMRTFDLGIPTFVVIKECQTPNGVRPLLSTKLRGENVPSNPQHFKLDGNVQENSTFTFLELQQCIDMGCKVTISEVMVANPVYADNGKLFRPLGNAIVEIIQLRKEMAKKYGKKSLPALICKLIANGCYYGKTAQNCIPTKTYSPIENEEESIDRGPSRLTQPVYASYITAGTRCILSCAGYGMFKHGFGGWLSQTTDGGITIAPEFLVNAWCNTPIGKYFKEVRKELSFRTEGREDDRLLVIKHISQELYNFMTRGNVGFCYDKEIQVPVSYKNEKYTDRGYNYSTYYVSHLLTDEERKHIISTIGEDYIVDGVCAMQGFKSQKGFEKGGEEYKQEIVEAYMRGDRRVQINTYKPESLTQKQREQIDKGRDKQREFPMSTMQKSLLKMNFDFKMVLEPENMEEVEHDGMTYMVGWARPPKDFHEAMTYRKITKNIKRGMRNVADIESLKDKVTKYKPLTKKQMQYFLEGYNLGLFEEIPMLDKLQGVDRLEFVNDFVKDGELTLRDIHYCGETAICEANRTKILTLRQNKVFEQTIKSMKEVEE